VKRKVQFIHSVIVNSLPLTVKSLTGNTSPILVEAQTGHEE